MTKKVLLVTSISPHKSAGLVLDYISVFESLGYEVNILTKYQEQGLKNKIISAYNCYEEDVPLTFRAKFRQYFPILYQKSKKLQNLLNKKKLINAYFANEKEDVPPVPTELYINKLDENKYDFVVITFMQFMFSTKSIGDIYNRLKVPVLLFSADMYPMTGGCVYFDYCRNFLDHCGCCPILFKRRYKDQAYMNFEYKQFVYDNSRIIFVGNTWMSSFANKTPLFRNVPVRCAWGAFDDSLWCIKDKKQARQFFGVDEDCFLMFAGASNIQNSRKGFSYLVQSVNQFIQKVNDQSINRKIVLMLAGVPGTVNYEKMFNLEIKMTGYLSASELSLAYSAVDVFLSSSIEDAGPSMVNQSLMCGTPVISYDIGVALDLIDDYKNGLKVALKNTSDYADAIYWAYSLNQEDAIMIQKYCREKAMQFCSKPAFTSIIANIIQEFC